LIYTYIYDILFQQNTRRILESVPDILEGFAPKNKDTAEEKP